MNNAYLYIDGFKFPISYLNFNLRQFTGTNNRPKSKVHDGEFNFTLDIDTKDTIILVQWMLSSTMQKEGYIEIYDFTHSRVAFKLEFANAYATGQDFRYDAFSNLPLQTNVTVTAGAIRYAKEVPFFQTWDPKNSFDEKATPMMREDPEEEKKPALINGWWSKDEAGNEAIQHANLGDTAYFHVETKDIECGEEVTATLREYDHILGIDPIDPDDKKFPDHEINKKAFVLDNNGLEVATFKLELKENWAALINTDTGDQIELYWRVSYKNLQKELPVSRADVLYVSYSKRTLYIKSKQNNINIPEMYSFKGEPIALFEYAKDEVKSQLKDKALDIVEKGAKTKIRKIALAKVIRDNQLADAMPFSKNFENDYYTHDTKILNELKNKTDWNVNAKTHLKNNPLQFYSKNGVRVQLLGFVDQIGNLIDAFNLVKFGLEEDLNFDEPIPISLGPIGDVAGVFAKELKAEQDEMLDAIIAKKLDLAKRQGIGAVEKFVNTYSHTKNYKYELLAISNKTASKLINGKFNNIDDIKDFNSNTLGESVSNYILFRKAYNFKIEDYVGIIETIFVDE